MRDFFSQFGKVVDATVMLDRETGRSKGFGFVSFENVDVQPMLGFGNLQIDGKLVSPHPDTPPRAHASHTDPRQIDVKLAQPRSQREGFAEGGNNGGGGGRGTYGNNGGAYGNQNYSTGGGSTASGGGQGQSTNNFDPQALAQLYTRMISQIGGMNPMMGGMSPGMMGGQYGGGMGGGMGMRGGMGMGGGQGMGMGRGGGMGMGMQSGPGSLGPNVPRGPRNAPTGPSGSVGPQRAGQRGQHSYHPYAR